MKYLRDIRDLNLDTLNNWSVDENRNTISVNCCMDTTNEMIDKYFGIDIMTNGVLRNNYDFWYVFHLECNMITNEILAEVDFCGATSAKYPVGYVHTFSLNIGDTKYLMDFLEKKCKEDTKLTLWQAYNQLDGCGNFKKVKYDVYGNAIVYDINGNIISGVA